MLCNGHPVSRRRLALLYDDQSNGPTRRAIMRDLHELLMMCYSCGYDLNPLSVLRRFFSGLTWKYWPRQESDVNIDKQFWRLAINTDFLWFLDNGVVSATRKKTSADVDVLIVTRRGFLTALTRSGTAIAMLSPYSL